MDEMKNESELENEETLVPEAGSEENAAPEVQPEAPEAAPENKTEPKPGLSAGKIALLVVLAVAAIAIVIALIVNGTKNQVPSGEAEGAKPTVQATEPVETTEPTIPADGNPDDVTCKGTYYVENADLEAALDTVIATAGGQELTNRQLQVYYWMAFYDFLDMYGNYIPALGMDPTASLDMQKSIQEGQTWQQFLLGGALENWRNYTALGLEAQNAAFTMDEEVADFLEKLPEELAKNAEKSGFESAEAMIKADMGPGADLETYMGYMKNFYLGDQYYRNLLKAADSAITDADIEAYFEEHAETYAEKGLTKETTFVDVRHILLTPNGGTLNEDGSKTFSDEEWEACRAEAQALLDEFLAGEQTEERFGQLATEHTEDPGSKGTAGLYKDVYKGQMVPAFDEWCFDASRAFGDTGLVKTEYGYHIMFYVSSRPVWIESARADLIADKGREEQLEALIEKTDLQVDYGSIVLGRVDLSNTK